MAGKIAQHSGSILASRLAAHGLILGILQKLINDFPDGENLLRNVARYSSSAIETSGEDGKECIKQEEYQLRYEWDQTRNQARQYLKTFKKCLEAWTEFEAVGISVTNWINIFQTKFEDEQKLGHRCMEDLERARGLLQERSRSQSHNALLTVFNP